MCRVLVVLTVHNETGNATAGELHWLLGRIRPDVIFLEHSSSNFSTFLDGSFRTLESVAVMRYHKNNVVELVPVDLDLPVVDLKRRFDEMLDRIEEASPRYCHLDLANRQHTAAGGLAYLNSPAGAELQTEIDKEMRTTVDAVGEPWLTDLYEQWARMNDLRELSIINEVEAFARRTRFRKGVLLVGAAHRVSLAEKFSLRRNEGSSPIALEFDWQLEATPLQADAGAEGTGDGLGKLG